MPSKFMRADDFPTFTGKESLQEQIRMLHSYLFSMRQELEYLFRNLSGENWNEASLQALTQALQSGIAENMQRIQDRIDVIAAAVQASEVGVSIGQEGKELRLVGDVYINGVLLDQGGGSA